MTFCFNGKYNLKKKNFSGRKSRHFSNASVRSRLWDLPLSVSLGRHVCYESLTSEPTPCQLLLSRPTIHVSDATEGTTVDQVTDNVFLSFSGPAIHQKCGVCSSTHIYIRFPIYICGVCGHACHFFRHSKIQACFLVFFTRKQLCYTIPPLPSPLPCALWLPLRKDHVILEKCTSNHPNCKFFTPNDNSILDPYYYVFTW